MVAVLADADAARSETVPTPARIKENRAVLIIWPSQFPLLENPAVSRTLSATRATVRSGGERTGGPGWAPRLEIVLQRKAPRKKNFRNESRRRLRDFLRLPAGWLLLVYRVKRTRSVASSQVLITAVPAH